MGKKLWGPKDISEFINSLATATLKPCKEAGTVEVHSTTYSKFEGNYVGSRTGDIVINVDAGVDVPTEPVDADARISWMRKAIGEKSHKIYVSYNITASTHPPGTKTLEEKWVASGRLYPPSDSLPPVDEGS